MGKVFPHLSGKGDPRRESLEGEGLLWVPVRDAV